MIKFKTSIEFVENLFIHAQLRYSKELFDCKSISDYLTKKYSILLVNNMFY